jgi:hypothetical protein
MQYRLNSCFPQHSTDLCRASLGKASVPPSGFEPMVSRFEKDIAGSVVVQPDQVMLVLRTSEQDGLQSQMPQLRAFEAQYQSFFRRKRRK